MAEKNQDTKKPKISNEQAEIEITAWLDHKRIRAKARAKYAETIQKLVDAIEEGILVYNPETNELTQKLIFPIEDLVPSVKELIHKPRVNSWDYDNAMKGSDVNDQMARVKGYIKAATGINTNTLKRLDSTDFNVSADLIVFFLT
jgi:hypothetical protein